MTVRGIDHIGLTVPDLEAATRFLADALGAEVLYDTLPAGRGPVGGPETEQRLGVPPGTRQLAIRMLALPDGPGIELFAYDPPGRSPALHDLGWQHLALYVDDWTPPSPAPSRRAPTPRPPPPPPARRRRQPLRLPPHPLGQHPGTGHVPGPAAVRGGDGAASVAARAGLTGAGRAASIGADPTAEERTPGP
ncbi:VOC family protein [Streptomyces albidoflavus]|uniref:VOC family protein n=1 Tax=Streptomyces albidoflavus TaxID=1886 RepID=UPI002270BEE1|nr:Catechol 2,3-dioxygenase [Streptomyces albidoflavus]